MSPRFGRASPWVASSVLSVASVVPPRTRTSFATGSTATTPVSRCSSNRTPVVAAAAVNEWPEPTGLTVRPSEAADRIACATSWAFVGWITAAATALWFPPQFVHAGVPMASEYPSYVHGVNRRLPRVGQNKRLRNARQDLVEAARGDP